MAKWETKREKAAGEIFLAVESDQRVHFRGLEDEPKAMWDKLEEAHLHKKPGARFNAYDQLFSIHKADDESLLDVATKVFFFFFFNERHIFATSTNTRVYSNRNASRRDALDGRGG